MPVTPRTVCLFFALALSLIVLPALAQDAPPHEGEGVRRQASGAKAASPKAPAPAVAKPGSKAAAPAPKKPAASAKKKGPAVQNDGKPYLRSVDKNHDGRITRDEFVAGSKKRFAKADANHDGVVSPQEGKAVKAAMLEKKAKRDAKRLAEGKPVKGAKKGGKPSKPYLSTFDKNKDGRVSQKEYLERREKKFAEMDLNRDGVVSREEARIAKKKILERREERKVQAKEHRLRKIEEARQKSQQSAMSSPGPEFVGTVTPPAGTPAAAPGGTPSPAPHAPSAPPVDLPLTPIAPGVPAQPTPET